MKSSLSPRIIFIVGPTAVGKTQVALQLARSIPAEIVSCDSMLVYRDVSIATSKPTVTERAAIPHHLIDLVPVEERFDVAEFNRLAQKVVREILSSGKTAIVAGGSGMYMSVLLDGIFEGGGADPAFRESTAPKTTQALYEQLKEVDPKAAARIHPHDRRRIVRALEVYASTRQPISELQKERSGVWGNFPVRVYGLQRERAELYAIIDRRVDEMFASGLMEEIRDVLLRRLSLTAERIIGIKELNRYFKNEISLEEARAMMKMNTRRLAKRQMTWFRKESRIRWIRIGPGDTAEAIARSIEEDLKNDTGV